MRPVKRVRKVKFKGARRVPRSKAQAGKEILRVPRSRRATSKKGVWHVRPLAPGNQATKEIQRVTRSGRAKSNLKGLEGSCPHKHQQPRKSFTSREAGAQHQRKGLGMSCPQAPGNQATKEILRVPRSGRATSNLKWLKRSRPHKRQQSRKSCAFPCC
ncbi:hypothetical protein NDU88_004390 [Pleurodeles waltl]|uniref:Uncharacterized protein n=1 Tax=Pleurodeles waltl TaxID=8319 RepID=A0AAV7PEW6_PLEWA|nr:hypothetical protein NDU88_004390 [Pleurodeles waltl]